jgi:hypothetical protein
MLADIKNYSKIQTFKHAPTQQLQMEHVALPLRRLSYIRLNIQNKIDG